MRKPFLHRAVAQARRFALVWCCGLSLGLLAGGAHAVTCTSAAAVNNWSVVGTWSCGHVPVNGDDVVIIAGGTTTLDVNSNTLASLTVNGTLVATKTDEMFAAGGVGVFVGGDGNLVAVDRFSIKTP